MSLPAEATAASLGAFLLVEQHGNGGFGASADDRRLAERIGGAMLDCAEGMMLREGGFGSAAADMSPRRRRHQSDARRRAAQREIAQAVGCPVILGWIIWSIIGEIGKRLVLYAAERLIEWWLSPDPAGREYLAEAVAKRRDMGADYRGGSGSIGSVK